MEDGDIDDNQLDNNEGCSACGYKINEHDDIYQD